MMTMTTMTHSLLLLGAILVVTTHAWSLFGARRREAVVRQYFEGVNEKNPDMIANCFASQPLLHDVVLSDTPKVVSPQLVAERCMEFVTAHPDCVVDLRYGPECGRSSHWVVAHWFEVGTWSGTSCGLEPSGNKMACQGQTRFLVEHGKIQQLVVTRTFTDWEMALILKRQDVS
jgi:hypothetical protein